jgi:hypothetical protein
VNAVLDARTAIVMDSLLGGLMGLVLVTALLFGAHGVPM